MVRAAEPCRPGGVSELTARHRPTPGVPGAAQTDAADGAARGSRGFAGRGGAGRRPPGSASAIGDGAGGDSPDRLREPATLFFIHECSHQDIAVFLGLSVATVNNRLRPARSSVSRICRSGVAGRSISRGHHGSLDRKPKSLPQGRTGRFRVENADFLPRAIGPPLDLVWDVRQQRKHPCAAPRYAT
jgi:hypothetical protein